MDIDWSKNIEDPISGKVFVAPEFAESDTGMSAILREIQLAEQAVPNYDQGGIKRWHLEDGMSRMPSFVLQGVQKRPTRFIVHRRSSLARYRVKRAHRAL